MAINRRGADGTDHSPVVSGECIDVPTHGIESRLSSSNFPLVGDVAAPGADLNLQSAVCRLEDDSVAGDEARGARWGGHRAAIVDGLADQNDIAARAGNAALVDDVARGISLKSLSAPTHELSVGNIARRTHEVSAGDNRT